MHDFSSSCFAETILKQEESNKQEQSVYAVIITKKQKTNNNSAMVSTTLGADGYSCTQSNTAPQYGRHQ